MLAYNHTFVFENINLSSSIKIKTTDINAVAWGGAGGARAPPIIWQTPKNIY